MISRRSLLSSVALSLSAPIIHRGRHRIFAAVHREYSTRTIDIIRQSTVIDMLGLLTLDYRRLTSWEYQPALFTHKDAQRLRDAGITVLHPAVGHIAGDIPSASLKDMQGWNTFLAAHKDSFLRVDCPHDLRHAKLQGKIGVVLGQQNSEHFRTVEDVDRFYALGQRVSQLTYRRNRLGGGSTDLRDDGLTNYGAQIVARMNAAGMAIDVSHCGDRTTLDAIASSTTPVLVTHSNCRALVPHSRRCKTDEAIKKLAARGGVIGITMVRNFVRAGGPATIQHVLNHVDHVAKLTGVEHVGIGSDVDLDGRDAPQGPKRSDLDGLNYTRKIYEFTEGLVQRGYSNRDIELILGGNFLRALEKIWHQQCAAGLHPVG